MVLPLQLSDVNGVSRGHRPGSWGASAPPPAVAAAELTQSLLVKVILTIRIMQKSWNNAAAPAFPSGRFWVSA